MPAPIAALAFVLALGTSTVMPSVPDATVRGDVANYTLALTWQPGICDVDEPPPTGDSAPEKCAADQPHKPLVGLHGLWADRPQSLIRAGISIQSWWSGGCDLLHHSSDPPQLPAALAAEVASVVPHFRSSLVTHEYDKHVQCLGFDAASFFAVAIAMRQAVADSSFGRFLIMEAGHVARHDDVRSAFMGSFGTLKGRALQLRCGRDRAGVVVLTQLWIGVQARELAIFPKDRSFAVAQVDEDNCPATFLVPSW
jgi:ribonuclease I (enterobacter ribonuclease)